jgi:long-chain acyl-CoA synthetase
MAVPDDPFLSLVLPRVGLAPPRPVLGFQEEGAWRDATDEDVLTGARALSNRLLAMGVEPGDRVALLSESRPEWAMALLGVWRSGGILVPLDVKATPVELAAILEDCRPRALLVSEAQARLARESAAGVGTRLESLEAALQPRRNGPRDTAPLRRSLDETAFLIYTSGTTGRPKGVEVTLGNLAFELRSLLQVVPIHADDVFVSILPLHHLFELVCGLLVPLHVGARVCYSSSLFPQDVVALLRERRATVMLCVPLFLKVMKAAVEREVDSRGRAARLAFRTALALARVLPMSARRSTKATASPRPAPSSPSTAPVPGDPAPSAARCPACACGSRGVRC